MRGKSKKTLLLSCISSIFFLIIMNFAILTPVKNEISQVETQNATPSTSSTISGYKTWGGASNDQGNGMLMVSSDIYIVGGTESWANGQDIVFIKSNTKGSIDWNITWSDTSDEQGNDVALDSSGNIYVVGETDSGGAGGFDVLLVKFNALGTYVWNATWGKVNNDRGYGIAIDANNNIFVVGEHDNGGDWDICLIKFDTNGNEIWNRTWDSSGDESGRGITLDAAGNIYLTGYIDGYLTSNTQDVAVLKYNNGGILSWVKTWDGGDDERGHAIVLNKYIYVAGESQSFGLGGDDIVVLEFDGLGEVSWVTGWGGASNDVGRDITLDELGNIYVSGESSSFGLNALEIAVLKLNPNGAVDWYSIWGGKLNDRGYGIEIDSSENVYVTGTTLNYGDGLEDVVFVRNPGVKVYSDEDERIGELQTQLDTYILYGIVIISILAGTIAVLFVLLFKRTKPKASTYQYKGVKPEKPKTEDEVPDER